MIVSVNFGCAVLSSHNNLAMHRPWFGSEWSGSEWSSSGGTTWFSTSHKNLQWPHVFKHHL